MAKDLENPWHPTRFWRNSFDATMVEGSSKK
jgi:hypothetical protein